MTVKQVSQMIPGVEGKGAKRSTSSEKKIYRFPGSPSRVHNGLLRINVHKLQTTTANQTQDENKHKTEVNIIFKGENNNGSDNSIERSPNISPSTSFSENQKQKRAPFTYERKLLKKRPDLSRENKAYYSDDSCAFIKDTATTSLDRSFWKKHKKNTTRHHSFSHHKKKRNSSFQHDRGYESSHETKRYSFSLKKRATEDSENRTSPYPRKNSQTKKPNNSDTALSSSTECEKESQKQRKLSTRRKISHQTVKPKEEVTGLKSDELVNKTSRFRRRRSSDHNIRYKYRNTNKPTRPPSNSNNNKLSKVVLLYSGSFEEHRNETIGNNTGDVLTDNDNDEYSSATSDVEYRNEKYQKGKFSERVWRSINNLLQNNNDEKLKNNNLVTGTPPLTRKMGVKKLSRSLPEGLSSHDLLHKNLEQKCTRKMSKKLIKTKKLIESTRSNNPGEERSRSVDYIVGLLNSCNATQQTKGTSKRSLSNVKKAAKNEYSINGNNKYNIILSHDPTKHQSNTNKIDSTKSTSLKTNVSNSMTELRNFETKSQCDSIQTKVLFKDLKLTLIHELDLFLKSKTFDSTQVNGWCRLLSELIKDRVMLLTDKNYKIITQVFIGALADNGIHAAVQSTSDQTKDGFFTVSFKGKDMYAVASLLTFRLED